MLSIGIFLTLLFSALHFFILNNQNHVIWGHKGCIGYLYKPMFFIQMYFNANCLKFIVEQLCYGNN